MDITNSISTARFNASMVMTDEITRKAKARLGSTRDDVSPRDGVSVQDGISSATAPLAATTPRAAASSVTPKNGESSSSLFMDEIKKGNSFDKKGKPRDPKLWDTCIEMESIFVKQMLGAMKKNVEKGEFLHGGYAEDIFEDMLYDEYATNMSKNADMGLAKTLYTQLSSI
jgi:hypothetical protein